VRPLFEVWKAEQEQRGVASVLHITSFAQLGARTRAELEYEIVNKPVTRRSSSRSAS
jgi:hypothetical protein